MIPIIALITILSIPTPSFTVHKNDMYINTEHSIKVESGQKTRHRVHFDRLDNQLRALRRIETYA